VHVGTRDKHRLWLLCEQMLRDVPCHERICGRR
jgi:gamma-glutamyl:cysteine ligase YbdK (ATP-grasp superfamily)